jgi:hypothetical protein
MAINFVSFVAIMAALVLGLALLSVVFAIVLSIAIRAFQGNT